MEVTCSITFQQAGFSTLLVIRHSRAQNLGLVLWFAFVSVEEAWRDSESNTSFPAITFGNLKQWQVVDIRYLDNLAS